MQDVLHFLVAFKGVAVVAWLLLLFLAERTLPAAPQPAAIGSPWRRLGRNVALWTVNSGLSLLIILPVTVWASGHALAWRPAWWNGGTGLAIDLVLLDGLIYWWHRANHRVAFLWRFHSVHHLDRFLDTTTALRFHFGEVLISALARGMVVILLAVPFASVLVFETLVLIATIFHHSNLRLPRALEAALSRIVVTPSIHWVHHHRIQRDTDSNYSTILSLWDPLYRSRSGTRRTPDLPIGVEGRDDRPLPALVVAPFV